MIDIVLKRRNGSIVALESRGHALYCESGKDIVCAAVSALIQAAVLGLIDYAKLDIGSEITDGNVYFTLDSNIAPDERVKADAILETMRLGLVSIQQGYSEFIQIVEKEV